MCSAPEGTLPGSGSRYAPGARVEIRDEEWMVRAVQATATGAHALRVVGVSDLVRGRDAMFLDDAFAFVDDVDALRVAAHAPHAGEGLERLARRVVRNHHGDDVVQKDALRRALRLDGVGEHDVVGPDVLALGGDEVHEHAEATVDVFGDAPVEIERQRLFREHGRTA